MATITNSNLFSESFSTLKNFINTNIVDPKHRYKKQWIHSSLPDITNRSFDGFPFITIDVDVSEQEKSFDRTISNKIFKAVIGIYSDQSTDVDSISDEMLSKFKDETLTKNLNEFKSIEVASSPFDFDLIGGKKISRRLIGFIGVKKI